MNHRIKALGLALLAALALGAVAASGASAVEHEFEVAAEPATITAEADPVSPVQTFTAAGVPVVCQELHATGVQEEFVADEMTIVPQWSDCEAAGFPATVSNDGKLGADEEGACALLLDSDTAGTHADLAIECEEEGSLTIAIFFDEAHSEELCTIHIGAQGALSGIHYENTDTYFEEITLSATVPEIHYSYEGPWCFLIFGSEAGTGIEASYHGAITLRAYGTNQVDATVSP